jgi:ATP-dependent RNA helicase MSS116
MLLLSHNKCHFVTPFVILQMVIGGTNINRERSGLSGSLCDLLIATPGRLQDHLDSTQGFVGRLWGVQVGWERHYLIK